MSEATLQMRQKTKPEYKLILSCKKPYNPRLYVFGCLSHAQRRVTAVTSELRPKRLLWPQTAIMYTIPVDACQN